MIPKALAALQLILSTFFSFFSFLLLSLDTSLKLAKYRCSGSGGKTKQNDI
jgi:hypothetical protein